MKLNLSFSNLLFNLYDKKFSSFIEYFPEIITLLLFELKFDVISEFIKDNSLKFFFKKKLSLNFLKLKFALSIFPLFLTIKFLTL